MKMGGGAEEVLAMLKDWGHKQCCSSFNTEACRFSHTDGGHKRFPPFKKGVQQG